MATHNQNEQSMSPRSSNVKEGNERLAQFLPLTAEVVQRFLDAWPKLEDYKLHEDALESLFKHYPKNDKLEEVLLKCSLLNEFYSAGLKSIDLIPMAQHIVAIERIDERLCSGDLTLVAQIAECPNTNKYLSFASKYCNWHNQNAFPIYDKYVVDVLYSLQKKKVEGVKSFTRASIESEPDINKRYTNFTSALKQFLDYLLSNDIVKTDSYKILDRILWLLGKYCFGNEVSVADIAIAIGEAVMAAGKEGYLIFKERNNAIHVRKDKTTQPNTKSALRELSKKIGFQYSDKWNTRQFGNELIKFINRK